MEKEIRDNNYVLIICTPNYRMKSDQRKGGVGYEGDIMTAEVLIGGNHRKFIPILARGSWAESAPSWLKGKVYVDLGTEEKTEINYSDLTATLPWYETGGATAESTVSKSPTHQSRTVRIQ